MLRNGNLAIVLAATTFEGAASQAGQSAAIYAAFVYGGVTLGLAIPASYQAARAAQRLKQ
jgi:hypothetical protein